MKGAPRQKPHGFMPINTRADFQSCNLSVSVSLCPEFVFCAAIDRHRVRVKYSDRLKHTLPVHHNCPWSHVHGIPGYSEGCKTLLSGEPVENYDDLRSCMQESPCEIIGEYGRALAIGLV